MNKTIIFIILIALMIVPSISALGITPGRTNFESVIAGSEEIVEFSVINSDRKNIELLVLVRGELNGSVLVSENKFSMSAQEYEKKLSYTFKVPSGLKAGEHTADILVIKLPDEYSSTGTLVGGTVAVATQLYVFIPYPDKYVDANLNVMSEDVNNINFIIPVHNRGKLDISRVHANIDIYGELNEKITTIMTNDISLLSGVRQEIVANWDASEISTGNYRAVATLIYDEETLTLENQFAIGKPLLELLSVEVNDFSLGDIAKFEMLVESKWSQEIKGAYAQTQIFNTEGEVMADFNSPAADFPALSKKLLIAFWDTDGVKKGTYDASVYLRYGEHSTQKDFKLDVSDDEIRVVGVGYVISSRNKGSGNNMVFLLIIVIGVLVLINIIWFLVVRKKLARK